ncbi:MAG: hypothetical protein A2786_00980 [Candidatus Chisholmbacteria bacterium RIFCSPHIGHO2_01_FULL_52_32]|uniref:Membrane protein 6-pyruvoyl-tetrahydropterin synthase-related domain-containing protein n=1 Tax=Candidatus Chisholmbacteria bacterium RIFCSPHIGHO2_01_FULL_52_32 TaxID=1797591 RepID=A0A1G1VUC6_9BACT|nr:MAG: hypothetical protein A2786_00980 [Candidatus Chisholmbacteria bacterium RIFCSPHIGHO2_01_FULL_52_32]
MVKRKLVPVVVILVIVAAFFWRLFFPEPKVIYTVEIIGSDIWNVYYPIRHFLGESLKRGEIPFWAKGMGTGFPVQANGQVGTFFLPNLALYSLLPAWLAWNLTFVLAFFLGFLGSYLFFRKVGLSTVASLFSGFSFSFGGYFVARIIHMAPLQTALLLPWVFLAGEYLWEKPTRWRFIVFSFVLWQQIAAGHLQWVVVTLVGFVLFFWIHLFERRKEGSRLRIFWVVAALVLGFALAAPQILETWEFRKLSTRNAGLTSEDIFVFPFSVRNLVTFVFPEHYGTPRNATYSADPTLGLFWENTAYIGILPLIFLVVALVKRNRKPWEWGMIVLGVVSLLLALGESSPLYFVHTLPVFNNFRGSARYLLLTTFAVTALAGAGLDRITDRLRNKQSVSVGVFPWMVMGLTVVDVGRFVFPYHSLVPVTEALKQPESAYEVPAGQRIFTDLSYLTFWKKAYLTNGWQDAVPFLYFKNALDGNLSMVFDRFNTRPLAGLATRRQEAAGELRQELISATSTEWVITPSNVGENFENLELTRTIRPPNDDLPTLSVYRNAGRLERFRFVSDYTVVDGIDGAVAAIEAGYPLATSVILESDPGESFEELSRAEIKVLEDLDQRLVLRTNTDKKALLVVADSFYPAWEATINGVETEILPANVDQRAVVVPPGENTIEFRYVPRDFFRGVAVSAGSLVVFAAVMLFGLWRAASGRLRKKAQEKRKRS